MCKKVLLFAGTTEGRRLCEFLNEQEIQALVCVTTEYGKQLLVQNTKNISIRTESLNSRQMQELIEEMKPELKLVIDATHPYASEASRNIAEACSHTGAEYLRVYRARMERQMSCKVQYVKTVQEAIELLSQTTGAVFVTTGSKELEELSTLPHFAQRVYARILPNPQMLKKVCELGLLAEHLICMQGPFSAEMNEATMRMVHAEYLLTKESGKEGGFEEKMEAAHKLGLTAIVIERPKAEMEEVQGVTVEEAEKRIVKLKEVVTDLECVIHILGAGMGNKETLTFSGRELMEKADLVIGAPRLLSFYNEMMSQRKVRQISACLPSEIVEAIEQELLKNKRDKQILILVSGDSGFHSGTKHLLQALQDFSEKSTVNMKIRVEPGISSIAYFAAKLQVSWEDAKLLSIHGKTANVLQAVRSRSKVFLLAGKNVGELCTELVEQGYGNLHMAAGSNLAAKTEKIWQGTPEEYLQQDIKEETLTVVYLHSGKAEILPVYGIPDEKFVRGSVPMTKRDIRALLMSRLMVQAEEIVYDIGAGTGSVSVELALQAEKGSVYAIECSPEGAMLIAANARRFGCHNIKIAEGMAPEAFQSLPKPDAVFIGGSKGNLKPIIRALQKKGGDIRLVVSAVTLETIAELSSCMQESAMENTELCQISISNAEQFGSHQLMKAQNPIFLFSCVLKGEN